MGDNEDNTPPVVVEGAGAGNQQGQVVIGNDGAPVLPLVEQPTGGITETQADGDQEGLGPGNVETQPLVATQENVQTQGDEGDSMEQTEGANERDEGGNPEMQGVQTGARRKTKKQARVQTPVDFPPFKLDTMYRSRGFQFAAETRKKNNQNHVGILNYFHNQFFVRFIM